MPWPAESLLGRLDAAIAWFLERVPMTPPETEAARARARENGFWIAGTQSLSQVQSIRDSLATAIENGEGFDAWRARIGAQLVEAVPGHAQTIYRNATQSAYNAGRNRQLDTPALRRTRPYHQYVAIDDGRTTDLCRELNGMILAADDPRWANLRPPNHHNCRATVRALRASEAEAKGGITGVPNVDLPQGWGGPAPQGAQIAESYPAEYVDVLRRRAP